MKIIYLSILLLLSISFVSADNIGISIINDTIIINGSIISSDGRVGWLFITINESLGNLYSCDNITNYSNSTNVTYQTNCRNSLIYNKIIVLANSSSNLTCKDPSEYISTDVYNTCLQESASYRSWYLTCDKSKGEMEDVSSNFTKCKEDLQSCNFDKTTISTAKDVAIKDKVDMETEQKDKNNLIWMVGAGCLAIGIFGTLYYKGHIGNRSKDPEQNFSRSQAG